MLRIQVARRCGRISSHRGDRCAQRVLARHRDVSPSQADLGNQPQPSQHNPVGWDQVCLRCGNRTRVSSDSRDRRPQHRRPSPRRTAPAACIPPDGTQWGAAGFERLLPALPSTRKRLQSFDPRAASILTPFLILVETRPHRRTDPSATPPLRFCARGTARTTAGTQRSGTGPCSHRCRPWA